MSVPELIEQVVTLVRTNEGYTGDAPLFFYGYPKELNKEILLKKGATKYPAFLLRLPFDATFKNGFHSLRLNIAIVNFTQRNYTSEERYTNVITPVIKPLYDQFLKWVRLSGLFMNGAKPDHEWSDKLFYGDLPKDKNVFTDPLDARELKNLILNTRLLDC